jgi:hypothetical protein
VEHEKSLAVIFSHLDENRDGKQAGSASYQGTIAVYHSVDWLIGWLINNWSNVWLIDWLIVLGVLDTREIRDSFQKLGVKIDQTEADRLLKRMDANGSLSITFDEFRDYFLWYPSAKVEDLFGHWRHSTVSPTENVHLEKMSRWRANLSLNCSLSIWVKTRWYRMILRRRKWSRVI